MKVIIVDDHEPSRKVLTELLKPFDHFDIIAEACNGKEFLSIINQREPDLVFMDYEMPDLDGVEATRKAIDKYRNVIIIGVSCHNSFQHMQQMIEAGARNYISKDNLNSRSLQDLFTQLNILKN